MKQMANRFPDFGAEYNQATMNTFISTLKQILSEPEREELKVYEVATATYTVKGDDGILKVSRTASGTCNLTLPLASNMKGRPFIIIDTGNNASVNNITLTASGSDTINGSGTLVMNSNRQRVMLYSDGEDYWSI